MMSWERSITLKTAHDLDIMRAAGKINAEALAAAKSVARPGVTTADLDAAAAEVLRKHGARPAFLGVPGAYPYPATTTVSVNDEMVHGIPGKRKLVEGDIVSIDCGTILEGYVADSAITCAIGEISEQARRLMEVTEKSLYTGIEQCQPGNRTGDIGHAIQSYVEGEGYYLTREYTGHGVGRSMWEGPSVPNYGRPGRGVPLRAGMTIAIEPMVLIGTERTVVLEDQWCVASADGSLTCHFEHTLAITENGPVILTLL